MLDKLKGLIFKGDNKRLFGNFLSLSVLQGTNLILPLITFPYLVRVLGVEKFGLISFALATIAYFEILTDYGFNFSATRQVSVHRDDKARLISIFSSVMTIKLMLFVVSLLILTILVLSFGKFSEYALVYYFTLGRVLGHVLFPTWFFQGLEKMRMVTYLNILSKAIFTAAIFVFVHDEGDLLMVPLLNSAGLVVAGLVALLQIRFSFGISFQWQSVAVLREQLKDGWPIFISRLFSNLSNYTNVFLLGLFTTNTIVGYYSVSAKIVEAITSVFTPANTALYPYMSKLFHDNVDRFYKLVKNVLGLFIGVAVTMFLGALIFGKDLITFVNGAFDAGIYTIYSILIWRILLAPFGPFLTLVFINQGRSKDYMNVMKYTMYTNLILVPPAIYFFSGIGMVIAVLIVRVLHVVYFLMLKINPQKGRLSFA